LGVGEAGRLLVNALRANDLEVGTVNCSLTQSRQNHPFEVDNKASHSAVIMAVNADQLDIVRHSLGVKFFEDRDVIGQWFWELSEPPESYRRAFDLIREVWAPTLFIKDSLETMAPERVSVVHMPLPIMTPKLIHLLPKNLLVLTIVLRFSSLLIFSVCLKGKIQSD
jgi:hypothetical protein